MKDNTKKQEILLSAFQILSKDGLDNITLKKVANEADIATGLILHYFDSKDHLINEVINFVISKCEEFYSPEIDFSNPNLNSEFIKLIDSLFLLNINDKISPQAYYSVYITALKDKNLKSLLINNTYKIRKNLGFYLDFFKRKGVITFDDEENIVSHLLVVLEGLAYYKNFCNEEYFYKESVTMHKETFLKLVNFNN